MSPLTSRLAAQTGVSEMLRIPAFCGLFGPKVARSSRGCTPSSCTMDLALAKLRWKHFQRGRTFLKRPAASRVKAPALTHLLTESRDTNRQHIRKGWALKLKPENTLSTPRSLRAYRDQSIHIQTILPFMF